MADLIEIDRDGMKSISQLMQQFAQLRGEELAHQEEIRKIKIQELKDYWKLSKKEQKDFIEEKKAAEKTLTDQIMAQRRAAKKQELDEEEKLIKASGNEQAKKNFEAKKKKIQKELDEEEKMRKKYDKKRTDRELKEAKTQRNKEADERIKEEEELMKGPFKRLRATLRAYDEDVTDEDGNVVGKKKSKKGAGLLLNNLAASMTKALGSFAKSLENTVDEISNRKAEIDTRLYGLAGERKNGSLWEKMSSDIKNNVGVSPYIKQADVASKISEMVGQGIAFNVEQRALLAVVKDKIATTFDAANGTLLRLVRIQQQDTTMARLGMEAALNQFLNNMYATTEYMSGLATQVKDSLNEAMSLMSGVNALSFEYQVQKWLGSLYSVGMSDSSVQGLSNALGQIAAGNIEGITGGGSGNLIVMAANQAGLSLGDILTNGLDESETNLLLNAAVSYLGDIYNESKDSRVVQQQMAGIFGMSASDLKAVANLSSSLGAISNNGLNYSSAKAQLEMMAKSMDKRTSLGGALSTIMENFKYTMAEGIQGNPALYGIYKAGSLLKDLTGGIEFGLPMFMGTGTAQTFNVADIMMTAALSGSILSGIGAIGSGLSQLSKGGGNKLLQAMGVYNGNNAVTRGTGSGLLTAGGITTSQSGSYISNNDSSAITDKTMTDQTDSSKQQTVEAADESEDIQLKDVNANVISIYELLNDVVNGTKELRVTGTVNIENPFNGGFIGG